MRTKVVAIETKEIRFIDLFAGVGGFRLGLERANNKNLCERTRSASYLQSDGNSADSKGYVWKSNQNRFKCVFTNEWDKYCCQTYNKNFGTEITPADIRDVEVGQIPAFDILCAGFPCQSFSIAGKRKGFQDTRGTMFFEICRIAEHHRPRLLFLENVKGLLNHDNGKTFEVILRSLDELGYDVEWQVLNSKHFGVPQNRERVFIVGHFRGECGFKVFPVGEEHKNVGERIEKGLQESETSSAITNTYWKGGKGSNVMIADFRNDEGLWVRKEEISPTLATRKHSESDISTMSPLIMFNLQNAVRTGAWGNGTRTDGLSFTLQSTGTERDYGIIRGNKIRRLTPIECERLQGFPDNWTQGVSDTQRYKQMGNAVTVNVIEAIGRKILEGISYNNSYENKKGSE